MTRTASAGSPATRSLRLAAAAAVTLAALAGCAKKADDSADDVKATAEVKTAVLADAALDRTVTAYGGVEFAPGGERTLSAPVEARVAEVRVTAGAPVSAGQVLIVLAPSPQTQIDLKKAADDARTAQEAYDRVVRLKASGIDSNADVESARATTVVAQATLSSLRTRAAGLTVTSPVTGAVETLTAAPGDLVASGASLGKVGQLSATRPRLGVDPSAASAIKVGDAVRLQAVGGGESRAGVVVGVDPELDPQTRLAGVLVDARGVSFPPGSTVKGEVATGQASGPVAPYGAIYYDTNQPYVLVVDKGVAHHRDVQLGARQGDQVELVSGVKAGERIVTEGGASLDDGTAVKEAPAAPAAEAPDAAKANAG